MLIVEDDESLSETLALFMETQGFEVVSANDGKPGVELFKADPHKFDFVLMDLTMSAMDGDLAFAEMKKIRENADIIMMSGYAEDLISKRLRGAKPLAFLKKPCCFRGRAPVPWLVRGARDHASPEEACAGCR